MKKKEIQDIPDVDYYQCKINAIKKSIEQQERYKSYYSTLDLLIKVWIGMFLISLLGVILLTALLITHPMVVFIICVTIIFIFLLKFIGGNT